MFYFLFVESLAQAGNLWQLFQSTGGISTKNATVLFFKNAQKGFWGTKIGS